MDWGSTQYSIMRFDSTGCQSPVLESQVNRNMLPYVEYMRTESPNTLHCLHLSEQGYKRKFLKIFCDKFEI